MDWGRQDPVQCLVNQFWVGGVWALELGPWGLCLPAASLPLAFALLLFCIEYLIYFFIFLMHHTLAEAQHQQQKEVKRGEKGCKQKERF